MNVKPDKASISILQSSACNYTYKPVKGYNSLNIPSTPEAYAAQITANSPNACPVAVDQANAQETVSLVHYFQPTPSAKVVNRVS